MSKIKFNQPKYIIPLLILPFIVIILFVGKNFFKGDSSNAKLESMNELNHNLPDAQDKKISSKFEATGSQYKKQKDYSGLLGLEMDLQEQFQDTTIYSSEEIREIEKMHESIMSTKDSVKKQQKRLLDQTKQTTKPKLVSYSQNGMKNDGMKKFEEQLKIVDSVTNPDRYKKKSNPSPNPTPVRTEEIVFDVQKATGSNDRFFNTIRKDKSDGMIQAILDEAETVKDGSRIRIRLLDDILLNNILIKKGTYLFGMVSGFQPQRVQIGIKTILFEREILPVNLTVYDNDGIRGLYIPSSDFRDIMKAAGSEFSNQQIQFQDGQPGWEEFAMGALQDAYRTTTQAVSKKIKQNKAKLKYGTIVYLVSEKELKKNNKN